MANLPPGVTSFEDRKRLFSYDRNLSLDVIEEGMEHRGDASLHDVSYASPSEGRTKAYLVEPPGKGPFAGVLFVHPGPGSRSTFLEEALMLAKMGAVSLLVNAPWAYPDFGERMAEMSPEDIRSIFLRTAIDLRRGVDFLYTLPEVDEERVGYVGHSFGALLGGDLSGVEKRIRAYVLMAGTGSFTDVAVLNLPDLKGKRLEEYEEALEPIDPIHYVGRATPSALFFQFGLKDTFFPRQKFEDYYGAGSEPKSLRWYDADHYGLKEAGRSDRIQWLRDELGLKRT